MTMTDEQEVAWEYAFSWYMNNGWTEGEADELAWRDVVGHEVER